MKSNFKVRNNQIQAPFKYPIACLSHKDQKGKLLRCGVSEQITSIDLEVIKCHESVNRKEKTSTAEHKAQLLWVILLSENYFCAFKCGIHSLKVIKIQFLYLEYI